MTDENKNTAPQPLVYAHIGDPRFLSEQVLTDGVFGGSLTFPMVVDPENTESEDNKTITVPFILKGNFGFSLGNKWESIIPQDVGNVLSKVSNLGSAAGLWDVPQVQFFAKSMSLATWTGSETPTFKIDIAFVATRRSYNPVNIIKALSATCLPLKPSSAQSNVLQTLRDGLSERVDNLKNTAIAQAIPGSDQVLTTAAGLIKNLGIYAPLNYNPKIDSEHDTASVAESCSVTLTIGKWFRASQLVVENVSGINFSRQTISPKPDWSYQKDKFNRNKNVKLYTEPEIPPDNETDWGFPLFVECSLSLRPIMMLTYDDFLSYFIQPKYTKLDTTLVRASTTQTGIPNTQTNSNSISVKGTVP